MCPRSVCVCVCVCVMVVVVGLLCSTTIQGLRLRATQQTGFRGHSGLPIQLSGRESAAQGRTFSKLMPKPGRVVHIIATRIPLVKTVSGGHT